MSKDIKILIVEDDENLRFLVAERLESEGFTLLNAEPKMGADNKWVCFLHPKNSHGVLVELCQDRG